MTSYADNTFLLSPPCLRCSLFFIAYLLGSNIDFDSYLLVANFYHVLSYFTINIFELNWLPIAKILYMQGKLLKHNKFILRLSEDNWKHAKEAGGSIMVESIFP